MFSAIIAPLAHSKMAPYNGSDRYQRLIGLPSIVMTTRHSILLALLFVTIASPLFAETWYIRADGGTRYDGNVPSGQCNGKYDAPYPGTGVDRNCAFNDFRYLWDDDSGKVGRGAWVISGGDTVVVRGCHAFATQVNPSNPDCRIGWDAPTGDARVNDWCYGVGSYSCYNPPIPAGTAAQPTRILGACAYGTYTCNPVDNYPYTSNLTQLFCGFSLTYCFNLQNTQHVEIEGIELTTHNRHFNGTAWSGNCTSLGAPSYPVACANNQPLDDYAQNGFLFNASSAHITFQDVYIHGFSSSGIDGPIGPGIRFTRVSDDFNAFAGWNFDDGSDNPDDPGATLTFNHLWMEGNGCYEQYPVVNTQFPARACYDSNSNGFGDALSGQDTTLDTLTCNHCVFMYNTKDAYIGPHTQVVHEAVTDSYWYGNMGAAVKWGSTQNSTVLFENNFVATNCLRMDTAIPGAAQNFNQSTGLGGSYLTNFCRAGGNGFAMLTRANSTNDFYGNTIVSANATVVDSNCGYYSSGNKFHQETNCGTSPLIWKDNIFLGYTDTAVGSQPGLWYKEQSSITFDSSFNLEYGVGNGDTCGKNRIFCIDPRFPKEPPLRLSSESQLDNFNFRPSRSSPVVGHGVAIGSLTADYFGTPRKNPPSIGAVEP